MHNKELAEYFEAIDDRVVAACATLRILGGCQELPPPSQLLAQEAYRSLVAALSYLSEIRDGVVTLEVKLSMVEEKLNENAPPF
jgi:hypothetical protein